MPQVSVVVPTHQRPVRLHSLIEALRGQSLASEQFEVLVVVDGADEDTRGVLSAEGARGGLRLEVIELAVAQGPSVARNAGWRAARGPVIAFTDDDCRPAPQWLQAGLAAGSPDVLVQGATWPDPDDGEAGELLTRTTSVERLGPQFQTCNVFYPRDLLEAVGGFDESWGWGGEDTDLAWRAIESGARPVFADNAVVFHAVERLGMRAAISQAARWTPAARLFSLHPETRAMLYRGVFWNVWHYLMWRSLLSLAGPRWLARLVLARHAWELSKRARTGGAGPWAIPFLVVHDLVECWAIARGAVRYRTVIL